MASFPHFGICVADVQQSAHFYCGAFGFEVAVPEARVTGLDTLLQLPGAEARTLFLQHPEGGRIELVTVLGHEILGEAAPQPANRRGLSHLCLVVDDLNSTLDVVRALGGSVIETTRVTMAYGELIFCTDPDGVRLELVQPSGIGRRAGS